MGNGKKSFLMTAVLVCVLVLGLLLPFGCKKKSEPAPSAEMAIKAVVQAGEQTTCPVTGEAIDKNVFVEYKGKKVYFCCAMCKPKFEADPNKYISKLPQFAK